MTIRVFEVNDAEWWAGDCSPKELLDFYMNEAGCTHEEATGDDEVLPIPLTEEQMNKLKFTYDDEFGTTRRITFAEHLADMVVNGVTFPCFFATTEW